MNIFDEYERQTKPWLINEILSLKLVIDRAASELYTAKMQLAESDDKIISDHICNVYATLTNRILK